MDLKSFLDDGLRFLFTASNNSTTVSLINYSVSGVSLSGLYDDEIGNLQITTGSFVTSGALFPIHSKQGSNEALLLEQGKLKTSDSILFLGSCQLNPSGLLFNIGGNSYNIISNGILPYNVNGSIIYNKIYVRRNLGSSLF